MNASGFLNSCNAFVDEGLVPISRNLLARLAHLAPDPIDLSLEVVDTPYVVAEVQPDPSGVRRFAIVVSRGLLVRLCYIGQVYVLAAESAKISRMFHTSLIDPMEQVLIPEFKNSFNDMNFQMCPDLRPVFLNNLPIDQYWSALGALRWEPYPAQDAGLVLCPEGELSIAARTLAIVGIGFVVMHEFAHVLLGHLHFIAGGASLKAYSEISTAPSEDSRTRQVLELDADIYAMRLLLPLMSSLQTLNNPRGLSPFTIFAGYGTLLNLVDFSARSSLDYAGREHPLPEFRYLLPIDYWEANLGGLGLPDWFCALYRQGWQEAAVWCTVAAEQIPLTVHPFYCFEKEIFLSQDAAVHYKITYLGEPMFKLPPGKNFHCAGYSDRELAELASRLPEVRRELTKIQRSERLRRVD